MLQFLGMGRDERRQGFAAELGGLQQHDEIDRERHLGTAVAFDHAQDRGHRPLGIFRAAPDDACAEVLEIHAHGVEGRNHPFRLVGRCGVVHAVDEDCTGRADLEAAIDDREIDPRHDAADAAQLVDVRGEHGGHILVAQPLGRNGLLPDVALQARYVPLEVVLRR